jgi:hypothetical protein
MAAAVVSAVAAFAKIAVFLRDLDLECPLQLSAIGIYA